MVELYDAEPERGAMLLERLTNSLSDRPVAEAVAVLGRLMRRRTAVTHQAHTGGATPD
jgi:streptomycin 6-kinase